MRGAGQPTRGERLHDAITRAIWRLILAPPLLACLALALIALLHRPRPVHTGDALLDAYLQAVVDHDAAIHRFKADPDAQALPEWEWLKLESRFGDDPRFWWLCYYFRSPWADWAKGYQSPIAGAKLKTTGCQYLEEARARGAVRLPHLLAILSEYRDAWTEEARQNGRLPTLPRYPSDADMPAYVSAVRKEIDSRHGAVEQRLLAEVAASAPGHPLTKYVLAMVEAERGHSQRALTLLREGNRLAKELRSAGSTTRNVMDDPFPPRPGSDELLQGKLMWAFVEGCMSGIAVSLRQDACIMLQSAATEHDPHALQELYLAGLHMRASASYRFEPTYRGTTICVLACRNAKQAYGKRVSAGQSKALADLDALIGSAKTELRSRLVQFRPPGRPQSAVPWWVWDAVDRASGGRWQAIAEMRRYAKARLSDAAFRVKMDALYAKLLRFDYVTLSWRDAEQ